MTRREFVVLAAAAPFALRTALAAAAQPPLALVTCDDESRLAVVDLGSFRTVEARDILIPLLTTRKISLWVNQVEVSRALEEALEAVGDPSSCAALAAWREAHGGPALNLRVGKLSLLRRLQMAE